MALAPGAWRFVLPPLVLAFPAFVVHPALGALAVVLAVAIALFFRDPKRSPPPTGLLSPADGTVSVVRTEGDRLRVGVFMNVWHVHVNRAPASGTIAAVERTPGTNRPAFSKDSDNNERVRFRYDDRELDVVLIAGAFARRITPYVDVGSTVDRGERIGHIAFGSRADVLFPASISQSDLRIEPGDSVRAGETVLARDPGPVEFDPVA